MFEPFLMALRYNMNHHPEEKWIMTASKSSPTHSGGIWSMQAIGECLMRKRIQAIEETQGNKLLNE